MIEYLNSSLKKYLDDLAARLPAPGGGSASALVASTGAALLSMTANFTLEKKGYEQYQDEIKGILSELNKALKRLYELIDLDVKTYEKVSAVYRLQKNTEEEKKQREQQLQAVLKEAAEVPYEILVISGNMLALSERLAVIGNKNLISDVGCGAEFLVSAINSAKLNVDINLKSINDPAFVSEKRRNIENIAGKSRETARRVYGITENSLI